MQTPSRYPAGTPLELDLGDDAQLCAAQDARHAPRPPSPRSGPRGGRPLQVRLADIAPDPDQPREEVGDEHALRDLVESIRERVRSGLEGVMVPVSVRPHPDLSSSRRYMLNFGHRRVRASELAGQSTIPAFVDGAFDPADQVLENVARRGLTPMEIALHVRRQVDRGEKGEKKAIVAARIGKGASDITAYLSLSELPAPVMALYRSGRCTSPKTLHLLSKIAAENASALSVWLATTDDLSRKAVEVLRRSVRRSPRPSAPNATSPGDDDRVSHDEAAIERPAPHEPWTFSSGGCSHEVIGVVVRDGDGIRTMAVSEGQLRRGGVPIGDDEPSAFPQSDSLKAPSNASI